MLVCKLRKVEQMKTIIAIDDELFARAQEFTGMREEAAVINEAVRAYVQIEAGRRLAQLGGTMPDAEAPPRRRPPY
jgi:Arc/MetJ family transcription regulator